MKIVIRGETRSGKSTLVKRLSEATANNDDSLSWIASRIFSSTNNNSHNQGAKKVQAYTPTRQIQVSNLRWRSKEQSSPSKETEFIKIELWDVVDEGINCARQNLAEFESNYKFHMPLKWVSSLITTSLSQISRGGANSREDQKGSIGILDATAINVYKHCDGAIFIMNLSSPSSVDYVAKQLANCPRNIPVLVIGSFTDLIVEGTVDVDFIERRFRAIRGETSAIAPICFISGSLLIDKEVKLVRGVLKFFELPFLQLQDKMLRSNLNLIEEKSLKVQRLWEEEQKLLPTVSREISDEKNRSILRTPSMENLPYKIAEPGRARLTNLSSESLTSVTKNAWANNSFENIRGDAFTVNQVNW